MTDFTGSDFTPTAKPAVTSLPFGRFFRSRCSLPPLIYRSLNLIPPLWPSFNFLTFPLVVFPRFVCHTLIIPPADSSISREYSLSKTSKSHPCPDLLSVNITHSEFHFFSIQFFPRINFSILPPRIFNLVSLISLASPPWSTSEPWFPCGGFTVPIHNPAW